jgi:ribosomal protein S18 acetylase RimI-like enzyme
LRYWEEREEEDHAMSVTSSLHVRRLGPEDCAVGVDAIARIKTPDGYPAPSIAWMTTFLSRPGNVLIVATEDGVPIGFVVAYLLDRVDREQQMMFFYEIGVEAAHRRRGIGRQMIDVLKAVCRASDVMKMWVPTGRSNVAATRLYASSGGVPTPDGDEVTYTWLPLTFERNNC